MAVISVKISVLRFEQISVTSSARPIFTQTVSVRVLTEVHDLTRDVMVAEAVASNKHQAI